MQHHCRGIPGQIDQAITAYISDFGGNLSKVLSRALINAVIFLDSSVQWFTSYGLGKFLDPMEDLTFSTAISLRLTMIII